MKTNIIGVIVFLIALFYNATSYSQITVNNANANANALKTKLSENRGVYNYQPSSFKRK